MMTEAHPEAEASIREAALAAIEKAGLTSDNWPTDDGTGDLPEAQPDDPEVVAPEAEPEDPETPAAPVAPASDDEVPTEYFGVDLSGLPAEARQTIIDAYKAQDRYIQSLQQDKGKDPSTAQAPPPVAAPEPEAAEPSDDDIMAALGVSPDDEMYEVKKELMLPMAKQTLQMQAAMEEMVEAQQVQKFEAHWNSTLDQLEQDHGKLPVSREELLSIAVANNIFDPADAYARVYLSGRANMNAEVEKFKAQAKAAAEEKKQRPPSTVPPRSEEVVPATKPELLDPKAAMRQAAKDLGMDLGKTLDSMSS
jgi:hypothetical protein